MASSGPRRSGVGWARTNRPLHTVDSSLISSPHTSVTYAIPPTPAAEATATMSKLHQRLKRPEVEKTRELTHKKEEAGFVVDFKEQWQELI